MAEQQQNPIDAASRRNSHEEDPRTTATPPHLAHKKSTAATVFCQFVPPSSQIRRGDIEALFSQVGPVKKVSVILPAKKNNKNKKRGRKEQGEEHPDLEDSHPPLSSSFGFVKFLSQQDAQAAVNKFHRYQLKVKASDYGPAEQVELRVQLASSAVTTAPETSSSSSGKNSKRRARIMTPEEPTNKDTTASAAAPSVLNKRAARVILRNLKFGVKESHLRKILQDECGWTVTDVHLPTVTKTHGQQALGFGFVTFATAQEAHACVAHGSIYMQGRPVQVAMALDKTHYEQQKQAQKRQQPTDSSSHKEQPWSLSKQQQQQEKSDPESKQQQEEEKEDEQNSDSDDSSNSSASSSGSSSSSDSDDDIQSSDEASVGKEATEEREASNSSSSSPPPITEDVAVQQKKTLFVRNLPFDVTRHDVFLAFYKFGHVCSIHLVKDKLHNSNSRHNKDEQQQHHARNQGSAFVAYETAEAAQRALQAAATPSLSGVVGSGQPDTTAQSPSTTEGGGGLFCKGRQLLVDIAVDKATAVTLSARKDDSNVEADKQQQGILPATGAGRDRRHLYLRLEGRVDNNENAAAWDELPPGDQLKRQRAWSDKKTKLRSPLFVISTTRLSIRNLAKHVTEADLKRLCVQATQRGLERERVTPNDEIALWRAQGDMSTREMVARIQQLCAQDDGTVSSDKRAILPEFSADNVKRYIPSVFVDRDFSTATKKSSSSAAQMLPPSRGFGFVEFTHHAHALACLRELNNNPLYSVEFVAGGKRAAELVLRHGKAKKVNASNKSAKNEEFTGKDGRVKVPRLIVEFTVENIVKARKQKEHQAQQQANKIKQKIEHREEQDSSKNDQKHKKSRGRRQRERKRRAGSGENDGMQDTTNEPKADTSRDAPVPASRSTLATRRTIRENVPDPSRKSGKAKVRLVRPPKKQKTEDKQEESFMKLVESYKAKFTGTSKSDPIQVKANEKRWFEE